MRAREIFQRVLPVQVGGAAPCLEREEHPRAQPDAPERHRERAGARVREGLGADPPRADRREDRQDLQSLRSAVAARADLLALLPKPDGEARAVYTGSIHPSSITDFALAAPLYFGELIVAHPFIHSGIMRKEYRPTEDPKSYRQEFLKTIMFFLNVMPLVDLGLINLIPDPCDFDFHLRQQMMSMAQARSAATPSQQTRREPLWRSMRRRSF